MATHRFDALTKQLGHARPRRPLLQVLLALLLGGLGSQAGAAQRRLCIRTGRPCRRDRQCCSGHCAGRTVCRDPDRRQRRHKRNKKNTPNRKNRPNRQHERCRGPEQRCGDRCVNVRTSRRHCGGCGRFCPGTCQGGTCVCDVCPDGCAFADVQAAVEAAPAGATLTICPGTYTGHVTITRDLTLVGAGADRTRLTTDADQSILFIGSGVEVQGRGLMLTGARGESAIGNSGTLTLTDCTLTDNQTTGFGGGIANHGTLRLAGCTVTDNEADHDGGGIENHGTLTLTDCTVTDNEANRDGGGIANHGRVRLAGCTVTDNQAWFGGGIANYDTLTVAAGTTVTRNTAGGTGGGIYTVSSATTTVVAGASVVNNAPDDCAGLGTFHGTCGP